MAEQAENSKPFSKRPHLKKHAYKPGQSGNPGGRPKGIVTAALLKRLLKDKGADLEAVVEGIIAGAKEGNSASFIAIRETVEGKLPQAMEHSGQVSGEVVILTSIPRPR